MRVLIRLLAIIVLSGFGIVLLGNLAERWVIYPFTSTEVTPESVGLATIEAQRLDINGESLIVWIAPPKTGKPVVLYFHGNAGNLAARSGRFKQFLERGYGVFAPAYRGSSGSSGTPSESALLWDAETLYHSVFKHFPDISSSRIVIYGESLGTALAIGLLTTPAVHPEKAFGPPGAVILEAPFTSIPSLAEHHYPGTGALAEKIDNTWRSIDRAWALTTPLLILHGTADELIPMEMGRQILTAAPTEHKDLLAVQGAGHTNLWTPVTKSNLWRFIDQFALR